MPSRKKIRSLKATAKERKPKIVASNPGVFKWAGAILMSVSESQIARILCLCLLPVAVLAFYPVHGKDYDIWFHLAYGRHYVENLTWVIDHTQFSWSETLPNWKYVTWIGSGLLYIMHQIAGIHGVFFLQWLIYLMVFGTMAAFLRLIGQRLDIWQTLGILIIFMAIRLIAVEVKPECFSTLFFTLAMGIYFYCRVRQDRYALFYAYPLLFFIWVNTHGGFLIGMFALTLLLALEYVASFLKKEVLDKRAAKHFALSLALSYIAVLINPHGIFYHIDLLKAVFDPTITRGFKHVSAFSGLWDYVYNQVSLSNLYRVIAAWAFLIMGSSFALIFFFTSRKKRCIDIPLVGLNLFFFFFGMGISRAAIFYPIIWFFSVNYLLWRLNSWGWSRVLNAFSLPTYLLLCAFIFFITFILVPKRTWFGWGLEKYWPQKEVAYIMKNKLPAPLLNSYEIGGYMMWSMFPEYKVWIDPRYVPYVRKVLPDYLGIGNKYKLNKEGLDKLLTLYPCKTALLGMEHINIIIWFWKHPDWRMVFFDKSAVVLVHTSVIRGLSEDALNTDLNTSRFREIEDPEILANLFVFYMNVGTNFAREIREIYAKNVSDWFVLKKRQLAMMDQAIAQREKM